MEIIFCLIIAFTVTRHVRGFSHCESKNSWAVFFFSDNEEMEVFIDGHGSGMKAPGLLYFPNQPTEILVEYKMNGLTFFSKRLRLESEKTLVMGQITPVINLLA